MNLPKTQPESLKADWFRLTIIIVFVCVLVGFIVAVVWNGVNGAKREKEARLTRNMLEQRFQQDIDRAKRATADPCATVPFDFAKPAAEIGESTKLFIFGNEIPFSAGSFDPAMYQFRPNKDRTELWVNVIAAQRYGEASHTWMKIGEKIWPPDNNPACKGK